MSERILCPNCFTPSPTKSKFCRKCGQKLGGSLPEIVPEVKADSNTFCINCFSRVRANAKFCPNCGEKIASSKQKKKAEQNIERAKTVKQSILYTDIKTVSEQSVNHSQSTFTADKQHDSKRLVDTPQSQSFTIPEQTDEQPDLKRVIDSRRDLIYAVNFDNELHELKEKIDLMERYNSFQKSDLVTLEKETNDVLKKLKQSRNYNIEPKILERGRNLVSRSNQLQLKMLEWMTLGIEDADLSDSQDVWKESARKLKEIEEELNLSKNSESRMHELISILGILNDHLLHVTEENTTIKSAISWDYNIKEDFVKARSVLAKMKSTRPLNPDLSALFDILNGLDEMEDLISTDDFIQELKVSQASLESDIRTIKNEITVLNEKFKKLKREEQDAYWQYVNLMKEKLSNLSDTQILKNYAKYLREKDLEKELNKPKVRVINHFSDEEVSGEILTPLSPFVQETPLQELSSLGEEHPLLSLQNLASLSPLNNAEPLMEIHQRMSESFSSDEIETLKGILKTIGLSFSELMTDKSGIQIHVRSWGINKYTLLKYDGKYVLTCRKRNFLSRFTRIEFSSSEMIEDTFTDPYLSIQIAVSPEEKIKSLVYFRSLGEKFLKIPGNKVLNLQNQGNNTLYIEITIDELSEETIGRSMSLIREVDLVVNGI